MSGWRATARGFTLIEMAIVLVVVGLIISGSIFAVAPIMDGAKATQTRQKLESIEKALVLYVIQNGCLPCPTDGGSAGNSQGLAVGSSGTYTSGCAGGACDIDDGDAVVPWGNLGLSREDATDGWGNYITYVVDADLAETSTSMTRTAPSSYPAGNLELTSATGSAITIDAAFVLISHGADGWGGRTPDGTTKTNPNTSNAPQVDNALGVCDDDNPCRQDTAIDADGDNQFDDIVLWRTAPMIIQMCGDNACGNPV